MAVETDSLGASANLGDAITQITRGIGQEVLDQTGGDHYRSGQPLRGEPEYVEPGSTPEKAPTEPEPVKEAASTAEPKLYAGKYKTIEEWERSTVEAGNTISRQARELDELGGRLRIIEQTITPPKPVEENPLDEVERFGIPKEPLQRAIESTFNRMLSEMAKPINDRANAEEAVFTRYPEFREKTNDLNNWIKSNPEVATQIAVAEKQGAYELAREFAILKYSQSKGFEESQSINQSKEQARERSQQLLDATVSDRKSGNTRDQSTAPRNDKTVTQEELDATKKLAQSGYERQAWAKVLGPLLPKEEYWQ